MRLPRHLLLAFVFLLPGLFLAAAAPVPLELTPTGAHHLEFKEAGPGTYDLLTTGTDPFFYTQPLPAGVDASKTHILSFEYFSPAGTDAFQVFFGPPISEKNSVDMGRLGRAETWQPASVDLKNLSKGRWNAGFKQLRLDPGTRSGVRIQIRNVQLREPNADELRSAQAAAAELEKKKNASAQAARYINAKFDAAITSVTADQGEIIVVGRLPAAEPGTYFLSELGLEAEPWAMANFQPIQPVEGNLFRARLVRKKDNADRLFSRWCVVRRTAPDTYELASHAVYATALDSIATREFATPVTKTKKGMGGVTYADISPELVGMGIEHVTVNVVLNSFLHLTPGKDRAEFIHQGTTFYVSNPAVAAMDRNIKFYSDRRMIVSAIILIGFPSDPAERAAFNHPEARSPGVFAMPNLTTADGARTYSAALAYLAERYSKPGNGLITHWILHNEVDYAWSWTNMGEQPMNVFMDHYVRSMRMAYLTARQFNPRARVFISLTHNWMTPEGAQGKNYVTRDMLDLLAKYSALEGDFEWGVAYHPYPQNLFEAAAWKDTQATFDFNTLKITPRNIEVLDAYIRQPQFLYRGTHLRGIMLSEQGFHTRDYSEAAQRIQAAALVYTWHKIRPLKTIECFQNHRWIDAQGEGGLLLGVRTLASPGKPFGDKKLAWSVFEALDTPREAEATAFALDVIGIKDFSEIPYRGAIK